MQIDNAGCGSASRASDLLSGNLRSSSDSRSGFSRGLVAARATTSHESGTIFFVVAFTRVNDSFSRAWPPYSPGPVQRRCVSGAPCRSIVIISADDRCPFSSPGTEHRCIRIVESPFRFCFLFSAAKSRSDFGATLCIRGWMETSRIAFERQINGGGWLMRARFGACTIPL
jgi:hypothetical protein